jgi:hypothetical protein
VKLAVTLVMALYGAKNQEEHRLRKAALEQTMEADFLAALARTAVHAERWQLGKR